MGKLSLAYGFSAITFIFGLGLELTGWVNETLGVWLMIGSVMLGLILMAYQQAHAEPDDFPVGGRDLRRDGPLARDPLSPPAHVAVTSPKRSEWEKQWDELVPVRRDFWESLNAAYQVWPKKPPGFSQLQDLLRRANVPDELSNAEGKGFWEWLGEGKMTLSPPCDSLIAFCKFVYYDGSEQFHEADGLLEGFDNHRRALSKLWDRWGRQSPLDAIIREQGMAGILQSSRSELMMLVYLEIERALFYPTNATMKSGLVRLARMYEERRT